MCSCFLCVHVSYVFMFPMCSCFLCVHVSYVFMFQQRLSLDVCTNPNEPNEGSNPPTCPRRHTAGVTHLGPVCVWAGPAGAPRGGRGLRRPPAGPAGGRWASAPGASGCGT
uniref:Uncharacterized protein n=1 Tax=Gadus morhua TaxID=8049 RepID=A0A8C5FAV4_GADMO